MKNPFASRELSDPLRRRVELAVAVAQERLLSTHVDNILKLIELIGDQVPFENALAIYTRLLRLSDDEARTITTRALAVIGERADTAGWPENIPEVEAAEAEEGTGGHSFFRQLRQRLKGRVNEELRRVVELSAARTEVAVMNQHLENALDFVELLEKEIPLTDAVALYLEALEVRDSIAEVVYYLALARLADERLPKSGAAQTARVGSPGRSEPRLRMVESDR